MEIPTIGFGTYQLSDAYTSVLTALKLGYRHIDTATLYKNEAPVGQAIRDSGISRREIFITTKVSAKDIRKGNIKEAVNFSLQAINCEYIDLILLHSPVKQKQKNIHAYQELLTASDLVRFVGVSNYNKTFLKSIEHLPKPYVNQIEVSPFCQQIETINYCRENGIKIVAHSSIHPIRCGNIDLEIVDRLSHKYLVTHATILLGWALKMDYHIIPKSSCVKHMEDNLNISLILKEDDMAILEDVPKCSKYPHFI
jgi:diketogulonate reductase-like aldo/keto reductase